MRVYNRQLWQKVCLCCVLFLFFSTAHAQWWRFGADSDEPVFSDLLFNRVNALRVDRSLTLGKDELNNGRVQVRGRVEIQQGEIGNVEATLDGGQNWIEIPFNEQGLFAFEFQPQDEHVYRFRIRSFSTTGESSNEAVHSFDFKVSTENGQALALAALHKLIERYAARDHSGFMALVAQDFAGNLSALDSAISNDFRIFDAIRIQATPRRATESEGRWSIQFGYNREMREIRSGKNFTDNSVSSLVLVRENDGFKLRELATPLIFGLSGGADVTTYNEAAAAGHKIILVDENGGVSMDVLGTGGGASGTAGASGPGGRESWWPSNLRLEAKNQNRFVDLTFDTPGLDLAAGSVINGYGRVLESARTPNGPWQVAAQRNSLEHTWFTNEDWQGPVTFYRVRIKKLSTGELSPPSNVVKVE